MKKIFVGLFVFLIFMSNVALVFAGDFFKPYLHEAQVPEHPKFDLAGKYSTNLFPGSAVYSYSFIVPPGIHGLQPTLGLTYTSQGVAQAPDIFGSGWVLSGNTITRNINGTDTISDDYFTLVLEGKNYDLVYDDPEYKTFVDEHFRILRNVTSAVEEYWVVTQKDGMQYRFGFTADSQVDSNTGKNFSIQWSLDLVTDTHGNTITYTYLENPFSGDNGTQYLSTIVYNHDAKRQINFSYEANPRPDGRKIYQQSNAVNLTRRLAALSMFADNSLVRSYRFSYVMLDNDTKMSSLSNITVYGKDNSTLFSKTLFGYSAPTPGYYNESNLWLPPVYFGDIPDPDQGVRLADINNDGLVDYLRARGVTGDKRIWLSNKSGGWDSNSSLFAIPSSIYFTNNEENDYGVRLLDLNNDGFDDILWARDGDAHDAWLNNGTGFNNFTSPWALPNEIHFQDVNYLGQGTQIADLNGDGRDDIIRAYHTEDNGVVRNVSYLNTGNGWQNVTDIFASPVVFTEKNNLTPDRGARLIDFNGDGLTDILQYYLSTGGVHINKAWFNTGNGWEESTSWQSPVPFTVGKPGSVGEYDNGVRFTDLNADGLIDIAQAMENVTASERHAWLNTGHGWIQADRWNSPDVFFDDENDIGRRYADVNGDGFAELIVSHGGNGGGFPIIQYTWVKNDTTPYLLENISEEFGGFTQVFYNESTSFNNTGGLKLSELGFNLYIVASTVVNNSLPGGWNVLSITNYTYEHGYYDIARREFRGFGLVNETLPDRTQVDHYFHQSDALKGLEYRTDTFNASRKPFLSELRNYRAVQNGSYYIVTLDNVSTLSYDGLPLNPKAVNYSFTYDAYGNVISKNYSGGNKREEWEYSVNTSSWIVDRVKRYKLLDRTTTMQEAVYSYDGKQNQVPQDKGELTRVDTWLSSASTGTQTMMYTYDSYGNLVSETDALGRVTTYSYGLYDETHTFRERETNALGHRVTYRYDFGTGNVLWKEMNNIKEYMYYDNFSRVWKEVSAYDSYYSPTKEYNYSFDGVAPERVQVLEKVSENETRETLYFYDGFGNFVQMKQEAEGNLSIVRDFLYDNRSRVKAESIPHYVNWTSNMTVTSTYTINYTYDPLGRIVVVRNPAGRMKTIKFVHFNITTLDERSNRMVYILDSYDRIVNVYEYNSDPLLNRTTSLLSSNTSYSYDVMDNLLSIRDNQSNTYTYSYDSLGRRIAMSDPDMGNWTYSYDVMGNLIGQEADGYKTNLSYDALNRVVQKKSNSSEINFSYDGQYFGVLDNVSGDGKVYTYMYDQKYRILQERKLLDGKTFVTGLEYDSADQVVAEKLNSTTIGYDYAIQGLIKSIPGFVNSSSYTAFSALQNQTFFTSQNTTYTYNSSLLRLTQIKTGSIQDLSYSYDDEGNVKLINDTINKRAEQMSYDNLDRLVNVTVGPNMSATYRYVYDETGRITKIVKNSNETIRLIYDGDKAHAPSAVIENVAGVMIYNVIESSSSAKNRTIQFYLVNEDNVSLTDINWTVNFGDGSTQFGSGVNLNASQYKRIQVSHVYASGSDYQINVTASVNGMTDSTTATDISFGIKPSAVIFLNQNQTNTTFTLKIKNTLTATVNDVSWVCASYSGKMNLTSGQEKPVNFSLTQSSPSYQNLICTVNSTEGNGTATVNYKVRGIEVYDFNTSIVSGDKKEVTFVLRNLFNASKANWSLESDGRLQNGSVTVNATGFYQLTKQINYSRPGVQRIFLNASGVGFIENRSETFTLEGLEIEHYLQVNNTEQDRIFSYTVRNNWGGNTSLNWSMDDPEVNNTLTLNMSYNSSLFVFIENNYTVSGSYQPKFIIYNSTMNATLSDRLTIRLLEIISSTVLHSYVTNTTVEFVVKNHVQRQNLSWTLNTGERNISNTKNIDLNHSQNVFIFVNYNNSRVGGFVSTAYVNSTVYNDSMTTEVVV